MKNIQVNLPERQIFSRLGYRKSSTELSADQKTRILEAMQDAYYECALEGVYGRFAVSLYGNKVKFIEHNIEWESVKLATFLHGVDEVFLFAVTAGAAVSDLRDKMMQENDAWRAVIYDAVASEVADEGAAWLNDYLRAIAQREQLTLTANRFSPGYGDLSLKVQADFVMLLELDKLGIVLNESYLMQPEKSVTAIVGLKRV